jgi:hypothetical protein
MCLSNAVSRGRLMISVICHLSDTEIKYVFYERRNRIGLCIKLTFTYKLEIQVTRENGTHKMKLTSVHLPPRLLIQSVVCTGETSKYGLL